MKKRKVVALRRKRLLVGEFALDLTYPESFAEWRTSIVSLNRENTLLSIVFHSPLPTNTAQHTCVKVTHLPSHSSACRLMVLPGDTASVERRALSDELHYLAFETHAVQLDVDSGEVARLFLSLENTQLQHPDKTPCWQPVIQWRWFFERHFGERYRALEYFPPEVDLDLRALNVDCSKVPQSTPMWFKLRTEVTGSRVYSLLGEFAPRPMTPEAASYVLGARDTADFSSGWRGLSVRLGNQRECVQMACVLTTYPRRVFHETGFIRHPSRENWGASPDGIVTDPNQTWDNVPEATREAFPRLRKTVTRGVIEFKASRRDCDIRAYHLMQCVWEMMCADCAWCDIVRYQESTVDGTLRYTCRSIRLFRCPDTEREMIRRIDEATRIKSSQAFIRLVWSDGFVAFRKKFHTLAAQCNRNAVELKVPLEMISEMHRHRESLSTHQWAPQDIPTLHPALDRIEERQPQLLSEYGRDKNPRAFIELATEQIQDYAQLVQESLLGHQ